MEQLGPLGRRNSWPRGVGSRSAGISVNPVNENLPSVRSRSDFLLECQWEIQELPGHIHNHIVGRAQEKFPERKQHGERRAWLAAKLRECLKVYQEQQAEARYQAYIKTLAMKVDNTIRGDASPCPKGIYVTDETRRRVTLYDEKVAGQAVTRKGRPINYVKNPHGEPKKPREYDHISKPNPVAVASHMTRHGVVEKPVVVKVTRKEEAPVAREKHWGELSDEEKAAKRAAQKEA